MTRSVRVAREANIALWCGLIPWIYGIGAWWLAYREFMPRSAATVLALSSFPVGFVSCVLSLAYARRVFEATERRDPARSAAGFGRVVAWFAIVLMILMGLLMAYGPTYQ